MLRIIEARITLAGELRAEMECSSCYNKIPAVQQLNLGPIARALLPQIVNLEIRLPVVAAFICEKCSQEPIYLGRTENVG